MSATIIKSTDSDNQAQVTSGHELKVVTSSSTSSTSISNIPNPSDTNNGPSTASTIRVAANVADGAGNKLTSTVSGSLTALSINQVGFSTGANSRVTVGNSSSVQLLAANSSRQYAYIFNGTGNALFIKFGASAAQNEGILIPNNAMFSINYYNLWLGTVNAISATPTGTVTVDVFEGTP